MEAVLEQFCYSVLNGCHLHQGDYINEIRLLPMLNFHRSFQYHRDKQVKNFQVLVAYQGKYLLNCEEVNKLQTDCSYGFERCMQLVLNVFSQNLLPPTNKYKKWLFVLKIFASIQK